MFQQSSEGILIRLRFVHQGRLDFKGCIIPLALKGTKSIWGAFIEWGNTGNNKYNPEKNDCIKFTADEAAALASGAMEHRFSVNNMNFVKEDLKGYNIAQLISVAFDNPPTNNQILVIVSACQKMTQVVDPNVVLIDD